MTELKSSHPLALRILMNEEIYRVDEGAGITEETPLAAEIRRTAPLRPEISLPEQVKETAPVTQKTPAPLATQAPAPSKEEAKEKEEPSAFDYLGENNRYMVIVHHSAESKFLPSKELESLISILNAKKMELKDVAVVNIASYPTASATGIRQYFACNSMVILGVSPQQLKLPEIPLNAISSWQGMKVLFTYDFAGMLDNNDKKRAFWNEMKKL